MMIKYIFLITVNIYQFKEKLFSLYRFLFQNFKHHFQFVNTLASKFNVFLDF